MYFKVTNALFLLDFPVISPLKSFPLFLLSLTILIELFVEFFFVEKSSSNYFCQRNQLNINKVFFRPKSRKKLIGRKME